MRVLCFGAYANGNVGDMYQAEALTEAVRAVRPDAEVTSVSPSKRLSSYPARNHVAGPVGGAFDHDYINSFDVMLVGGGGLFAAPHHPLNDEAWVEGLRLPVVAVAVGAAGETPQQSAAFVQKCHRFSVRDEFSHRMVGDLRPDVAIVMDPILLRPTPRPVLARDRRGIVWVPGKVVPGTVAQYADLMERLYEPGADLIVSLNPETDKKSGFEEIFGSPVHYLDSAERFQEMAASRRLVVSERYHGCILALNHGVPCVGLGLRSATVTSKISEMYRRFGFPDSITRLGPRITRKSLRLLSDALDLDAIDRRIAAERVVLHDFLDRSLA